MKNLKPVIFIVIVLFLTAISAYPQRKFGARVIEVIDGKTCVLQVPGGKLTVLLQYIEVPDPDQPLFNTVKQHLEGLVLDKAVEFMPRGVIRDRTVVRLFVKNVDVSQQMLRDGAAWYSVLERSSQDEDESLLYRDNEAQAKTEKRGVWGINLQPSWIYRAEKAALQKMKEEEAARAAVKNAAVQETPKPKKKVVQPKQVTPQVELWADVGGANQYDQPLGVSGLRAGYDPAMKVGHISTPSIYLDFPNAGLLQKVDSRLFYLYKGDKANVEDSVYVIGFIATAKDYMFVNSNSLTITADAQRFALGNARRFSRQDGTAVKELLLYQITRAQLLKMVKARRIGVQIGDHRGGISTESLAVINKLLGAS
jgi:endonuclease YncB( thermonuclease family)